MTTFLFLLAFAIFAVAFAPTLATFRSRVIADASRIRSAAVAHLPIAKERGKVVVMAAMLPFVFAYAFLHTSVVVVYNEVVLDVVPSLREFREHLAAKWAGAHL